MSGKSKNTKAEVTKKVETTPPPAIPATETTHGQAAEIHAAKAKTQAAEATTAAGGAASEATLAAKEKLSQAGEATVEATVEVKDKVVDTTYYAGEKIADATALTKEKLTEAGESVQKVAHSAVEYIKEHLPRVEHEELSPEELQSKVLLDEAMGRPGETIPGLATEVEVVIGKNRPAVGERLEGAILDEGGGSEEERSAKGLAEVMKDKAEEGKAYIRQPTSPSHTPHVHEYSALPGDIHIPLVKKAWREHVLHRPEHKPTSTSTTTTTTEDIPRSRSAEEIKDAEHGAAEATHTAEEKATHAAHTVGETLSEYYHKVADPISGALHSAEDKAKWTFDHTKEELVGKSAVETHKEMQPKNEYEAELAHGAIPSSTEEVLSAKLGESSLAESGSVGPKTPTASGGGRGGCPLPSSTEDSEEVMKMSSQQQHGRLHDLVHGLDSREPGSEGEIST